MQKIRRKLIATLLGIFVIAAVNLPAHANKTQQALAGRLTVAMTKIPSKVPINFLLIFCILSSSGLLLKQD